MFPEGVAIPGPPGALPVVGASVLREEGVPLQEVEQVGLLFFHGNQYNRQGPT